MFAKDSKFSILDHVEKLSPTKERNRFYCPVCGGNNLTINPKNGSYKCWNECSCSDIRNTIAPWQPNQHQNNKIINIRYSQPKKVKSNPVPLPKSVEIAKADGVTIEPAATTKKQRVDGLTSIETRFDYTVDKWVIRHERLDANGQRLGKKFYSQHHSIDGEEQFKEKYEDGIAKKIPYKGDSLWPAYRESEADLALQNSGNCLLVVEGEPCTEAGWELGLGTITFQGSSWSFHEGGEGYVALKCLRADGLVIWPDNDRTGISKAQKLAEACAGLGIWTVQIDPAAFDLPEKGDIVDAIAMHGPAEVRRRIEQQLQEIVSNYQPELSYGGGDGGGDEPPGKVSLRDQILEIYSRKLKESDRQIALLELAKATNTQLNEIRKLADLLEEEFTESDINQAQKNLEKLLTSQSPNRLKISNYLWGDNGRLADAIEQVAAAIPTAPEFIFTTLIPVAASRIGTSSKIVINPEGTYSQPCIFWSAIVARSGRTKTPAQEIVVKPLISLEADANKQFKEEEKNYEAELEFYNSQKKSEREQKPEKPVRKRYLTSDITSETLERIHGENPKGLLLYRDELAGLLKARNQYKKGVGADEEAEISQHNGSAIITDRGDRSVFLERSAVSRTGSIQWEVAQDLLNQSKDGNGGIARWLFCAVDAPPRFINLTGKSKNSGTDIKEMLRDFYQQLEQLPERDYLITPKAAAIFEKFQHGLVRRELTEIRPGFENVYPKIQGYTARFALWLHLCNAALAGVSPTPTIDDRTMAKAIELAKFYLGQAELIYGVNSDDGLTGDLLRLYRFCEGKGEITARQVKQSCSHFKKDKSIGTATIKEWFGQLAQMGYGSYSGDKFVVSVVNLLLPLTTMETPTQQGLQKSVVNVVNVVTPKLEQQHDSSQDFTDKAIGDRPNNSNNNQAETLTNQGVVTLTTSNNKLTTVTTNEDKEAISSDPIKAPQIATEVAEINDLPDRETLSPLQVGTRVRVSRTASPGSPLAKKLSVTRYGTIVVVDGDRYQIQFDGSNSPWGGFFDRKDLEVDRQIEVIQLPLIE